MTTHFSLAHALGLRPLDRVQLNTTETLSEMRHDARHGRGQGDLPFWFFQRITPDGLLEVMSAGGSTLRVSATEVCDVIRGEPIEVRAMPASVFLKRLSLPLIERGLPPPESCFSPAYVRWVRKDRWGRLDEAFVSFLDERLNGSPTFASPLIPCDRDALQERMNRRAMPVSGPGTSSYSSDHGVSAVTDHARYAVAAMIRCARQGLPDTAASLCEIGANPLTSGKINRMIMREAAERT